MRSVRTLALGIALLTGAAGCVPRPLTVECVKPAAVTEPAECHDVADRVARLAGLERAEIGTLTVISVEHVDCHAVGLTQEILELDAPSIDRCWRVVLDYEGGGVEYVAARDRETGGIGLFE
jgi:hypothetical protein